LDIDSQPHFCGSDFFGKRKPVMQSKWIPDSGFFPKLNFSHLLLLVLFLSPLLMIGQTVYNEQVELEWYDHPIQELEESEHAIAVPYFKDAFFSSEEIPRPLYVVRFEVPGPGEIETRVNLTNTTEPGFEVSPEFFEGINSSLEPSYIVERERGKYYARVFFHPFTSGGNEGIQLVESFNLTAVFSPGTQQPDASLSRDGFKSESEFAEGQIFKIGVSESGLFKLDAAFINNQLGLSASDVPVDKIRILGNRGGMLPQLAGAERTDDIEEIPSRFFGSGSHLGQDEFLLFFAEGPHIWHYDDSTNSFDKPKNIYDDLNYYFIVIGSGERMEIPQAGSVSGAENIFDNYEFLQRHEVDRVNIMGAAPGFYGSGQRWFGDNLSNIRQKDYSGYFDLEGFIPGTPLEVYTEFAIRSNSTSTTRLSVGQESFTRTVSSVNVSSSIGNFARLGTIDAQRTVGSDPLSVHFEITNTGSISESWMDFLQIRGFKDLIYEGTPLLFRNSRTMEHSVSAFDITNPGNRDIQVWDITTPHYARQMPVQSQGQDIRFSFFSDELKEFIAFHPTYNFPGPEFIEAVPNQNLHGLESAELVIVYYEDFESPALQLADHRRSYSGLDVVAVPVQQVYNEFGGGSPDPTAIRDFARMFYTRSDDFRYLLLVGDGSYDHRGRMEDLPEQNFIPVFQTNSSLNAIGSFPSDDYFALLDPNEGGNLIGAIDIAVGRLPVRTAVEAQNVVDKIISYDTNPKSLGDWKLNLGFVADNGDNNLHLTQTRRLIERIGDNYPKYNIGKVYLDAFERVSTPGGNRFPEANQALNKMMNRGPLVVNFFGHGGPSGWTQERVLQIPDILSWDNSDRLTLMVTATCSFANYDDPAITSGGEHVILNPNGGAVALLTTTRLVYAFANERLTRAVFDRLFERGEDGAHSIGTVMMMAKNANSADTLNVNARKFTLLGDPSQKLALPRYRIATTEINGASVDSEQPDTLKALQSVEITGEIRDDQDRLVKDFNGVMDFTLFDKPVVETTLGQGGGSNKQEFKVQNNVLFKGSATVSQGRFTIEFMVPVDINYQLGYGKASYYAHMEDGRTAAGAYEDLLIGGSVDSIPEGVEGPSISLYMNNENFVSGGITDANPTLLAILESEVGINVTGNSIGRELTAWFYGKSTEKIGLNDFYQAERDDFRRGEVRYPLRNLEDGSYEVNMIAWDILNNRGEASIEFVVTSDKKKVIQQLLNFPNPLSNHTEIQFEHNLPAGEMDIRVSIYSITGEPVSKIRTSAFSDGYRVTGIQWDGTDRFGGLLPSGIYLYNVSISTDHPELNNKTVESEFERLVIMR
jgi:hypothetical protein